MLAQEGGIGATIERNQRNWRNKQKKGEGKKISYDLPSPASTLCESIL